MKLPLISAPAALLLAALIFISLSPRHGDRDAQMSDRRSAFMPLTWTPSGLGSADKQGTPASSLPANQGAVESGLSGMIVQASSLTGIDNAFLVLHPVQNQQSNITRLSTRTDAQGQFHFPTVQTAQYQLHISHPSFRDTVLDLSLNEHVPRELRVELPPLPPPPPPMEISIADEDLGESKMYEVVQSGRANKLSREAYGGLPSQEAFSDPSYGSHQTYPSPGRPDQYPYYPGMPDLTEPEHHTENYDRIFENPFKEVMGNPISTFSIDVDAASYANIRRFLDRGQAVPKDAVRIEEMVNYFSYDYPAPRDQHPFSVNTEISVSPWNAEHHLIHIGLQGLDLDREQLGPSNLVFLIDVSGSMDSPNKLGLVKTSLLKLLEQLGEQDRVAIVVYASATGVVLPSTPASDRNAIRHALNNLKAGGSTAGGAGLKLAYQVAEQQLIRGGNNRVILCTDGDFNVGLSSDAEMIRLMEEKRKTGIYMTVCGFGMGNYKDGRLEKIAQYGNGNYFYLDKEAEAEKVFGREMRATLFTIAQDLKLQLEFNPAWVESYRLIGYENRIMAREDFDNDLKDAGELGAGHSVTALYEVRLRPQMQQVPGGDQRSGSFQQVQPESEDLRYQRTTVKPGAYSSDELLSLKLRYKKPGQEKSVLMEHTLSRQQITVSHSSENFRWSAAVAAFGMILRDSQHKGQANLDMVLRLAEGARGPDPEGYRAEFIRMVGQSRNVLVSH